MRLLGKVDSARPRARRRGVVALASLGAISCAFAFGALASCGGGGESNDASVIDAGSVDIKLPKGYRFVRGKVVAPVSS